MSDRKPMRLCVACRTSYEKNTLLRVIKDVNGHITVDRDMNMQGRGGYICRKEECINLAKKRKAFERALRMDNAGTLYEELMKEI